MTSRQWLLLFAILNAICGAVFKSFTCEVIFVVVLFVLFFTREQA